MSDLEAKVEKSIPSFRKVKINTCSQVTMKHGQTVAVPYKAPKPASVEPQKVTEKRSISQDVHSIRSHLHAGMNTKPLGPYSPNAERSRLRTDEALISCRNVSEFVIGDRSRQDKRHFVTMAQNLMKKPKNFRYDNQGIVSEMTKRKKINEWR